MKVAMYYNNNDIRIEEMKKPNPGQRELLVKVMACGICGSDVVEWYRRRNAPLVCGHELGGEIVGIGKRVNEFKIGDRVFVAPKVPCMECRYCKEEKYPICSNVKERYKPGGFSEYIIVPETHIRNGVYLLPENMSYDQSTFIEPLACVVRAQRLAGINKGDNIIVLGSGISGLLHIALAKIKGAERVLSTDINDSRLEIAKKVGADEAFNAKNEIAGKFDIVIICTGAMSAAEQAWGLVDNGGSIVFFAVPDPEKKVTIPINEYWTKEIRIITSYYCGPDDIWEAISLIDQGLLDVDNLITHKLPLDETKKGFELMLEGKDSLKVIIRPN